MQSPPLLAMVLGAFQLVAPKGTAPHRALGYAFVVLIALVALSSFWISEFHLIGPFSPIHALSVLVLYTLVQGIRAARAGRVAAHRRAMRTLYLQALLITGAVTLLPGRTMHAVLFGA